MSLLSVTAAVALIAALASPAASAPATFHLMSIKEVYAGSDAAPDAHYVVLQMYAAGQQFVAGTQVRVYDPADQLVGTFTFPVNLGNGADQATILIATTQAQMFFAVPPDLVMTPVIPRLGGKACFLGPGGVGVVDCVAWGGYAGPAADVGTPFNSPVGLMRGVAMRRRLDVCGLPSTLDMCDDTGNSANDFLAAVPGPRNNGGVSGTIPPSVCGNSIVQSLEQCDDGNLAGGDGCSAACARETNAFTPQALVLDPAAGAGSDGNGVLEPGEQAAMRPSWRNAATAPLSMTGALSTFGGPPGATYTIADGTGGYGTIAPAQTRSCADGGDCYALGVSNPTPRPAAHWDATSAEVNSSYGFKTWSVHVGRSFTDVPSSSPFYRFVETIVHKNVTGGCSAGSYCPSSPTARDQMAVFVLVAREPPGFTPPACVAGTETFLDVPAGNPFCRWIEELARRGVAGGCGGGNYCPTAPVSRDAMAVFVLRTLDPALDPPACTTAPYGDVPPSSPFCRWILELTNRGVVTGCGGGNYCPQASVTREQMGVFLTATFGLVLYGP
jgi:cysteine-rich repeat protein